MVRALRTGRPTTLQPLKRARVALAAEYRVHMAPECCRATPRELVGKGGRGTSSSPFPQGELWGKGKPSGELLGELYIGEGEGGTLGEKQLSGAR